MYDTWRPRAVAVVRPPGRASDARLRGLMDRGGRLLRIRRLLNRLSENKRTGIRFLLDIPAAFGRMFHLSLEEFVRQKVQICSFCRGRRIGLMPIPSGKLKSDPHAFTCYKGLQSRYCYESARPVFRLLAYAAFHQRFDLFTSVLSRVAVPHSLVYGICLIYKNYYTLQMPLDFLHEQRRILVKRSEEIVKFTTPQSSINLIKLLHIYFIYLFLRGSLFALLFSPFLR